MNDKERSATYARIRAEHGSGIARLVRGYASRREDQEDLLQEIALALWRALPGFRGACSERTFVYRIAHNRCVDRVIRRRPLNRADIEPRELACPAPNAEAALMASTRRQRLTEAIQQLPLPQRQVLLLALEEMSHAEIADVVGITPNNVAVRLTRARKALRNVLTR
ncbi:MAG: sigma-70 family RNA polymerase sigma factor [Myxococcota bacterium]